MDEAVEFYRRADAPGAAVGFVAALELTFALIRRNPQAGSPRYGHELGLPGLRAWPLPGYPYLVFYVEQHDRIDVWRVLHAHRHIPSWMPTPREVTPPN